MLKEVQPVNKILFLGLDLGVSTVKAALFTLDGELVALESNEYMIMPEGEIIEADPEIYWTPTACSIRKLLKKWGGAPEDIAAVSISSHGESVFPMSANGKPVRKALNWMDTRSKIEAAELTSTFGAQKLFEIGGQPTTEPIWPATKLRWMSKHEAETIKKTASFLLPEDYILFRLSGQFVGEYTLWGSSLVFDIRLKTLSDELLAFSGISASQIPNLYPSGTAFGNISSECAGETGLSTRTRVVTGALDQICAAISAGNVAPGMITESTGSVLALLATIKEPIFNLQTMIPCHLHAVPDAYCLLPWNPTGGLAFKWFKDSFAPDLIAQAKADHRDVYDLLTGPAAQVMPGSDGLIMLPNLEGAFFPEFDPQVRGVFFGFTLSHTRAHFSRAIMEAIAYMLRRDLEGLNQVGVVASELRVLGGGAKSQLWAQIKADVCNLPVITPNHHEAAVLGAAILAAVGVGAYADIASAVKVMARPGRKLIPQPANRDLYDNAFNLYVSLYEALKPIFPLRTDFLKIPTE